jgi:hypothetical protein
MPCLCADHRRRVIDEFDGPVGHLDGAWLTLACMQLSASGVAAAKQPAVLTRGKLQWQQLGCARMCQTPVVPAGAASWLAVLQAGSYGSCVQKQLLIQQA